MKSKSLMQFIALASLVALTIPLQLGGQENQQDQKDNEKEEPFVLTSATFANGGKLPVSMALNQSGCAPDVNNNGGIGGDESPQMSWTRPRHGTRSFVVVLFDRTDGFTHWGMYNISPEATGLPPGTAGMAGSPFGQQVDNDFGLGEQYDGPCPPTSLTPATHEYVLTVYALDVELTLPKGSTDFPPDGEILFHKLIEAGREGHILQSASISGFFAAVTPSS